METMEDLLRIKNLKVSFDTSDGIVKAVDGVSLCLKKGESIALVGESGSGKTMLCRSILGMVGNGGLIEDGSIIFDGHELVSAGEELMKSLRGRKISMIFQDPAGALDPGVPVGDQIGEVLEIHGMATGKEAKSRAMELMRSVSIPDVEIRYSQYPCEFSGGMKQRVAIAIALAAGPDLILADEPTTGLDGQTQRDILDLINKVRQDTGAAMIFITHDLSIVKEVAEDVAIMKDGRIIERGSADRIFSAPEHEYTKRLIRYANYGKAGSHSHTGERRTGRNTVVDIKGLCKSFPLGRKRKHTVLERFDLTVSEGEIVGLVGRSGCGKSTLAKCICGIEKKDGGLIDIRHGVDIQMIFQDTGNAFNDRMTVREMIGEPVRIATGKNAGEDEVLRVMDEVDLSRDLIDRKPWELSGGERQRVAIARAIIRDPDVIVADEPLTGLDVSSQAQIVHLFRKLVDRRGLALLFIAHDIPMVEHISDRIVEMEGP